jgi:NDP-mannose synthase
MVSGALIMAGGRGQRLYPYTAALPKPLMPIGDKPILEHIIRRLHQFAIRDIVLAVNHLAPLIETYFGDGSRLGCRISYLREDIPVGTAGPIALLPDLNDSLLVMNADVICDIDYAAVFLAHRRSKATITVASHVVSTVIGSGVLDTDSRGHVVGYREKPSYDHRICMGIYVIEPRVRRMMEPGRQIDMPELISRLIAAGEPVVAYNHTGQWIDIGKPEDYARAQADVSLFTGAAPSAITQPVMAAT